MLNDLAEAMKALDGKKSARNVSEAQKALLLLPCTEIALLRKSTMTQLTRMSCMSTRNFPTLKIGKAHLRRLWVARTRESPKVVEWG